VLQAANTTPPPLRGCVCVLFAAAAASDFCNSFFGIFAASHEGLVCRSLCQFQIARILTSNLAAALHSLARVKVPQNSAKTVRKAASSNLLGRTRWPVEYLAPFSGFRGGGHCSQRIPGFVARPAAVPRRKVALAMCALRDRNLGLPVAGWLRSAHRLFFKAPPSSSYLLGRNPVAGLECVLHHVDIEEVQPRRNFQKRNGPPGDQVVQISG